MDLKTKRNCPIKLKMKLIFFLVNYTPTLNGRIEAILFYSFSLISLMIFYQLAVNEYFDIAGMLFAPYILKLDENNSN